MRIRYLAILALPTAVLLMRPVGAKEAPPPSFKFVPQKLTAATRAKVARLYGQTCSGCHGMSGEGAGNGLSLFGAKDPLASAAAMHFGRSEPPPLKTIMPAYGAQSILTPVEIGQLAEYIKSFRPSWP